MPPNNGSLNTGTALGEFYGSAACTSLSTEPIFKLRRNIGNFLVYVGILAPGVASEINGGLFDVHSEVPMVSSSRLCYVDLRESELKGPT